MVIELSGVQFGLKSYAWFQNRTSAQREFDLKSQVWFQTKIARHGVQLPLYFWCTCIVPVAGLLKKKSGTGNAFTSHLVCKTMSCDENSSEHDKETSGFEVRTKIVYFSYKSSILVAWINDGRSFFLLWLRLRLFIVFGEGIWRCILRNPAMDFFWVVKLECSMPSGWYVLFFFHTV